MYAAENERNRSKLSWVRSVLELTILWSNVFCLFPWPHPLLIRHSWILKVLRTGTRANLAPLNNLQSRNHVGKVYVRELGAAI